MKYRELLEGKATDTEIREYLADGSAVAITFRIPENLKAAAQEEARMRGMSFSAFMRMCMMNELSGRR